MVIFDSHCHLDSEAFDADRAQVLERCRASGIRHFLVPGVARAGWDRLLTLCDRETGLYPALGLHPVFIEQHAPAHLDALQGCLAGHKVYAIGEIGLDFYIDNPDRARQRDFFVAQLEIARAANLPVILHIRKAHDEVLALLRKHPVPGGFAHAFNGSLQQARQFIDLGFRLGFGGTLTYPGSHRIHALAKALPPEAMVLETDAPDMAVAAHRGERNSPEYILDCLQALAALRGEEPERLAEQTTANVFAVLGHGVDQEGAGHA
ncbi:MAG TPA: TatD family deoxyribonuclease [Aliiroseovarius sp.]|nr:TatD family deoxyribonuclease [Aliiroseovarius sp.]